MIQPLLVVVLLESLPRDVFEVVGVHRLGCDMGVFRDGSVVKGLRQVS
jgi:hypothetical protein